MAFLGSHCQLPSLSLRDIIVRKSSLVFMSPFLVSLLHEVYKGEVSGLCPGKPVSEELMERISLVREGLQRALGHLEEFSASDI